MVASKVKEMKEDPNEPTFSDVRADTPRRTDQTYLGSLARQQRDDECARPRSARAAVLAGIALRSGFALWRSSRSGRNSIKGRPTAS